MAAERCPLGRGLYWENDGEIPDICIENCGNLMDDPLINMYDEYDVFPDDGSGKFCDHTASGLQTEDCSLQRGVYAERIFSITDECMGCGMEYGAQSYEFTCKFD